MANDYIRREDAVNIVIPAMVDGADAEIVEGLIYMIEPADVVQVVRCQNCEAWQTDWNPSIPDRHYCAVMDSMMKADDFCSHGEREE